MARTTDTTATNANDTTNEATGTGTASTATPQGETATRQKGFANAFLLDLSKSGHVTTVDGAAGFTIANKEDGKPALFVPLAKLVGITETGASRIQAQSDPKEKAKREVKRLLDSGYSIEDLAAFAESLGLKK